MFLQSCKSKIKTLKGLKLLSALLFMFEMPSIQKPQNSIRVIKGVLYVNPDKTLSAMSFSREHGRIISEP